MYKFWASLGEIIIHKKMWFFEGNNTIFLQGFCYRKIGILRKQQYNTLRIVRNRISINVIYLRTLEQMEIVE